MAVFSAAARFWLPILLLFGAVLYLPWLGTRPLRFEEGRRALQAIEMLEGGAWWHLKVLGLPYINKPPLTPWLIAGVALARGVLDEVAVRLPGVLFALAGGLSAGICAYALTPEDRRIAALSAGLGFLCSVQILFRARIGETDVTVTALCGIAFAIWLMARQRQALGPRHWLAIGLLFACAALTKGLIPILFPACAMIGIPLIQRQWREAVTAFAVILAAHVPLAIWAFDNLAENSLGHWAVELRLASSGNDPVSLWRTLRLNDLPAAIVCQLPFLPAAVAMVVARPSLPRERRWIVDALVLFALPMAVMTTILPVGKVRYSMPATWPVAVLAGLWIAANWRRLFSAHLLAGAELVLAVVMQMVQIGILDGRTTGQRAFREREMQFLGALEDRMEGPTPLLWSMPELDFNLLAAARHSFFMVNPDHLACLPGSNYLVAGIRYLDAVAASGAWIEAEKLSDWGLLYRHDPNAPVQDCVP